MITTAHTDSESGSAFEPSPSELSPTMDDKLSTAYETQMGSVKSSLPYEALLRSALDHEAGDRFLQAAEAYNAALMLNASDADVWNNFGVVLAKSAYAKESAQAFENALMVNRSHANALDNLARVRAMVARHPQQLDDGLQRDAAQGDPSEPRFACDWQVGATSGWSIYGLNLVLHTLRRREFTPIVLYDPDLSGVTEEQHCLLNGVVEGSRHALQRYSEGGVCPFPCLHALGNGLIRLSLTRQLRSTRQVGMVFFEDTQFDHSVISRGRTYDRLVAGSTWNEEVLKGNGLEQTTLVFQGIDTSVFYPAPRTGRFTDRFVVFSGGKLEYRKGQDLVIAAFARFRQRHPEALLMVAWHNHWVQTTAELVTAGHVRDLPSVTTAGRLELIPWLVRHGIPMDAVLDLGLVPNAEMASLLRESDVALFPNRAEGGTNLVAMETLACGVPCIISENTGHLDLISDDHNVVLRRQDACRPTPTFRGTDGWGESDVDEIVEALEFSYQNREEMQRRAANAALVMANASWGHQIDRLFAAIGDVLT